MAPAQYLAALIFLNVLRRASHLELLCSAYQLTAAELEPECPGVLFQDFAGFVDFGFTGSEVLVGDFGEVVEIVEVDVFDVFDGGVDVAGQGEVDEEAGSIGAALHGVAKGRHVKDRARCGGGADNDIEMLQLAGEVCKING